MVILLFIHILFCCIVMILFRKTDLNLSGIFPILFFVPVFGFVCILINLWMEKRKTLGSNGASVDHLMVYNNSDRSILMNTEDDYGFIPLEEAIAINDASTQKQIIMDLLEKNPEKYTHLLKEASLGKDTEVAHYAVTEMMEIQTHYEKKIYEMEERLKKLPNYDKVLRNLRHDLKEYIKSGLLSGKILLIYQKKFLAVLLQLIESNPLHVSYWLDCIDCYLACHNYEKAEKLLKESTERFPENEQLLMLYVKYYWSSGKKEELKNFLQQIKNRKIPLSKEGKEWFEFWYNGE